MSPHAIKPHGLDSQASCVGSFSALHPSYLLHLATPNQPLTLAQDPALPNPSICINQAPLTARSPSPTLPPWLQCG